MRYAPHLFYDPVGESPLEGPAAPTRAARRPSIVIASGVSVAWRSRRWLGGPHAMRPSRDPDVANRIVVLPGYRYRFHFDRAAPWGFVTVPQSI